MSRPSVSTPRTDWLPAMFWKLAAWVKTSPVLLQVQYATTEASSSASSE